MTPREWLHTAAGSVAGLVWLYVLCVVMLGVG